MQSATIHESAYERFEEEARRERLGKVHHRHLGNGKVRVSTVASGRTSASVHAELDRHAAVMRDAGGESLHRTKIGRNAACPCGSGRKFKKCCIGEAVQA